MSEKQVSAKVCSVVRPASPVCMVKPELVEPKFPGMDFIVHRSIPDAVASHNRVRSLHTKIRKNNLLLRNALCDDRPVMNGLKGMSWEPVAHYTSNERECGIA